MQKEVRADTTQLHDGNALDIKVEQQADSMDNAQQPMVLIEPGSDEGGNTHSQDTPVHPGASKAPKTTASAKPQPKPVKANGAQAEPLVDKELPTLTRTAEIPNEQDPSQGYLEKEGGMPVINSSADEEFMDDDESEMGVDDGLGDEIGADFADLPSLGGEDEEFEDLDIGEDPAPEVPVAAEAPAPVDMPAAPLEEEAPLVDVDGIPDTEDADNLSFASINATVHVIRANRIIASLSSTRANKLGIGDVYNTDQYFDVVAHEVGTKGLRAGLVKQGFVLAKVKLTANSASEKVIKAKVEAGLSHSKELLARQAEAMEQSLAIAAVGINKKYFKDVENTLKAALISELERAGVRGAKKIVSSCFSEHGVPYAKSLLTLANKIATMPAEVRNLHADSLDMTNDEDFVPDADEEGDVEAGLDCENDEMEEEGFMPASVSAALTNPNFRRSPARLLSSEATRSQTQVSAALARLKSDKPLV